jgi:ribosome-associated protein
MDDGTLQIDSTLAIPRSELTYRATRSGGPGGQHVNTSSTRIELTWNIAESPALTDEQRARLMTKLANRIDARGVLRMVSSGSRSQYKNRETVTTRFAEVVAGALRKPRPRRRTRPPASARESRIREKKQRSDRKRMRGPPATDD